MEKPVTPKPDTATPDDWDALLDIVKHSTNGPFLGKQLVEKLRAASVEREKALRELLNAATDFRGQVLIQHSPTPRVSFNWLDTAIDKALQAAQKGKG